MTESGKITNTKSIKKQITRFSQIIKIWSQQISEPNTEVISMSDTNINLELDYTTPQNLDQEDRKLLPLYRILHQEIFNKGASFIPTKPTKIHHKKNYTFIDHLITNLPNKIIQNQVIFNGSSDHLMTKFTRLSKSLISQPKFRTMRKFSEVNWYQLRSEIQYDPDLQTAETSKDPQVISSNLIKIIEKNLSNQAPLKRVQTNKKHPKFISPETRQTLNQRDSALSKSKLTNNDDDIRHYKTLRNLCHKLISKDKKKSTQEKYKKAEHNSKQLWQITKDTIGWSKNPSPNTLSHQGKTYHSPKAIADIINITQISRNIKLHREIPKTKTDPTENFKKLVKDKNLKFEVKTISMRQLSDQMNQMKPTPSSGIDNISIKTIKQIYPIIKKSILNLINSIITTGQYPQELKCAKIIPILKPKKTENDPLSYRCVNILPSLAKIVDRTLNLQVTKHLTENNLLIHQHFGGIQGRSTITAIMTMLDEWAYALEKGDDSAILILDQSAAFDIVWHPLLLKKMEILGFQQNTIKLFTSYLKDRRQRVLVDSFLSNELSIGPLSVCQGSTLSGILYIIYTLNYPLLNQASILPVHKYIEDKAPKTTTFVDDSNSRISLTKDKDNNNKIIKDELNKIQDYMNANRLVLNQEKSKILVITNDDKIRNEIKIPILGMDEPLKPVRNITYLGIDIDDQLKWNFFIEDSPKNLIKEFKKRLTAVRIVKNQIDFFTTRILLNGLFHSKLLYGAPLWAGAPNYLKKQNPTYTIRRLPSSKWS